MENLVRALLLSPESPLRRMVVSPEIPVVYSTEIPGDVSLLPLAEEEFARGKVDELAALDNFRVRILPVLG
jgi:hypothetical protein